MSKSGVQVQLSISEIYNNLCPECKIRLKVMLKDKLTDQIVNQVIGEQ